MPYLCGGDFTSFYAPKRKQLVKPASRVLLPFLQNCVGSSPLRFVGKERLVNKCGTAHQTHYPHRNCNGIEEYPLGFLRLLPPGTGIPQMEN